MSYSYDFNPNSPYRQKILVHDDLNDKCSESEQRLSWDYEEQIPVDGSGKIDHRELSRRNHKVFRNWVKIRLHVTTRYIKGELFDMDVDIYMNTPTENEFMLYLGVKTDAYNIMRHFKRRGNAMVCEKADLGRFGEMGPETKTIAIPCANLPMQFHIDLDWDPMEPGRMPCVVELPKLPGMGDLRPDVHFPVNISNRLATADTEQIEGGGPQLLVEDAGDGDGDDPEEPGELEFANCEQCGDAAWDGYICHNCGAKDIGE